MQKIWKIKYLIIDKVKILIIEPHLKKEKSSKMEDFSDFSSSLEDFRLKRNIFGNNEGTAEAVLLNENTEFNAKPELEIYADDVKCSHGSASGNLNEESIFYLKSRGLNYKEAKKLLINGFLLDVVEKITDFEIKNLMKNIMNLKQWTLII